MRRIGMSEIAKLANVSIGTVGRALNGNGRIKESTRERILQIAQDLGYKPNLAARALSVGKSLRIGICIPRELHFFYDYVRQGIFGEAHRNEHLGVEVAYRPVCRLGEGEIEKVKELLNSDIQSLILTPADPKALTPLINKAEQQGIRVVCLASDAPQSNRSSVVCVEPILTGKFAGEIMGMILSKRAEVAIFTGMLQTDNHQKRVQGFSEVLPQVRADARLVDVIEGYEDEDGTFAKCVNLLRKNKRLSGIYVSTVNCLPVCRALRSEGLAGQVKLITSDLFREMLPYFNNGTIAASIYQRPYEQGQAAVRLLIDHFVSGRPVPSTFYLDPNIVLRSNLGLFREMREAEQPDILSVL
jgi:LacI family transcriptional regulator